MAQANLSTAPQRHQLASPHHARDCAVLYYTRYLTIVQRDLLDLIIPVWWMITNSLPQRRQDIPSVQNKVPRRQKTSSNSHTQWETEWERRQTGKRKRPLASRNCTARKGRARNLWCDATWRASGDQSQVCASRKTILMTTSLRRLGLRNFTLNWSPSHMTI